jgi:hypothetical protein
LPSFIAFDAHGGSGGGLGLSGGSGVLDREFVSNLFDPDALAWMTRLNAKTV